MSKKSAPGVERNELRVFELAVRKLPIIVRSNAKQCWSSCLPLASFASEGRDLQLGRSPVVDVSPKNPVTSVVYGLEAEI